MADNVTTQSATLATIPASTKISTDEDATNGHVQRVKLAYSADGVSTHVTADADGMLVNLGANNDVVVSDGGNVISVDDGAGSLTVDGTVSVSGAVDTELTTADLDTGAGTDTRAVVGLVGSKSGGGALIPGDATAGLKVDLGADNDVTVTGTVTANLAAGTNNIGDVDVLSVPAPLSTTGGGTEATALRVTVANDSTGVLSVDDNAGSLTVDNAALAVTGGGVEATALRVTVATDSTGVLSVDDNAGSLTVDGSVSVTGTATTSDTATLVDDAAFTPATSRVLMIGAEFDDTTPDSVNEGDGGAIRMSANRNAYTTIRDAAGNERGVNVTAGNALTVDGSATTQPVSGTVTANLAAGTNNIGDVDVLSVPAPLSSTGGGTEAAALRVTLANDSTGLVSVDDNGGSLTVDVGTALPAGTNNIGDVDVLSVIPGTGATNLGKAIDSVAGATDTGVAPLAIRDDTLSALTPIEGDWTPLRVNSTGALHVTGSGGGTQYNIDDVASATATGTVALVVRKDTGATLAGTDGDITGLQVDASGSLRVTGGGGGTEYVVNAVAPADPTGATFVMERDDALSALTEIEGDWTNPRSNANGALWVKHDGVISVDDNAGSLTVDGTVTANLAAGTNNIGDVDVLTLPAPLGAAGAASIAKAEDAASADLDVGVPAMAVRKATPANTSGTDGDYEMLQMSAGRLWTSSTIDAAIPAGTNNIGDVDVLTLPALPAGTNNIGDVDVLSVVPGTGATNLGKAEDAAHTTADTGVYVLGVRDDSPAAHSGTDGDYESLHVNAEGGTWVSETPSASGGLTIFRSLDLDETEEEVKATAGTVYGWYFSNLATTTRFLKFYNATAANVTVGTTTPVLTFPVPGNSSDDVAANMLGTPGIKFDTAITVAVTTGLADNDTGAPAANDFVLNLFYK